ncbi:hypothetical protein OCU04_007016 [Sclerotinia nivalis]|uniref:Uncharacterized protein n=1 Tax=Sclerotinia nivalis TaxID=352851 RepID=A0A9X0DJH8_9HELO|nr:hypothetical protein OCU04_007016 [Sclerotinia nivalis]
MSHTDNGSSSSSTDTNIPTTNLTFIPRLTNKLSDIYQAIDCLAPLARGKVIAATKDIESFRDGRDHQDLVGGALETITTAKSLRISREMVITQVKKEISRLECLEYFTSTVIGGKEFNNVLNMVLKFEDDINSLMKIA